MMKEEKTISADFPYDSKYIDILGSKIHYIEEGEGKPILFLHGIPSSNYLWRNIIPYMSKHGRCIALDLIGMGQSDKPMMSYDIKTHIRYLETFIEKLGLKDITLVMHGFGSVIGLDYAMRHEDNLLAFVFFEAHLRPITEMSHMSLPMQELTAAFRFFDKGFDCLMHSDPLLEDLLTHGHMRKLTKEEKEHYYKPFAKPHHRKVIVDYLREFFHHKTSDSVTKLIQQYSEKLQASHLPKLMFYAIPGFNTTVDTIIWAKENLQQLTMEDLGEDLHFVQETKPHLIGEKMVQWFEGLFGQLAYSDV